MPNNTIFKNRLATANMLGIKTLFLRFCFYFLIPLRAIYILVCIVYFFASFEEQTGASWLVSFTIPSILIYIVIAVTSLVFLVLLWFHLRVFSKRFHLFLWIYVALDICAYVFNYALTLQQKATAGNEMQQLMVGTIIIIAVLVYFNKRKMLFGDSVIIRDDKEGRVINEIPVINEETTQSDNAYLNTEVIQIHKRPISKSKIAIIALSAGIVIISCSFLTYVINHNNDTADLQSELQTANNQINTLTNNYNEARNGYNSMISEYNFYHDCACIVTVGGEKYHQYGCSHIGDSSFYIYNIENAEYLGYEPCLDCWKIDLPKLYMPLHPDITVNNSAGLKVN